MRRINSKNEKNMQKENDNMRNLNNEETKTEYFNFDLNELEDEEVENIGEGEFEGTIIAVENCSKTYLLKIQLEDCIYICHISKKYRYQPRRFLHEVLANCKNTSSKNLIGLQVYFETEEYTKDDGETASSLVYIELADEEEVEE